MWNQSWILQSWAKLFSVFHEYLQFEFYDFSRQIKDGFCLKSPNLYRFHEFFTTFNFSQFFDFFSSNQRWICPKNPELQHFHDFFHILNFLDFLTFSHQINQRLIIQKACFDAFWRIFPDFSQIFPEFVLNFLSGFFDFFSANECCMMQKSDFLTNFIEFFLSVLIWSLSEKSKFRFDDFFLFFILEKIRNI